HSGAHRRSKIMSIVIDSLRPNEACREQVTPNDRCRIDASFHTVSTETGNITPHVTRMEPQDLLHFRRVTQGNQVRFVLDQGALNSLFRGLTMTHHFNPEGDANLQAAFNFSVVVLIPFQREGGARERMRFLTRLLEWRGSHQDLELSVLEPMEALESSTTGRGP